MKIGRNAPCPCGSGKKYKRCCLQLDRANRGRASDLPLRQVAAQARIWQADILPFPARFEDDPGARPATVLVTADGLVLFNDILACPSAEVEDIASELHRGIFEAAASVGAYPSAIEVREDEVAAALARRISDGGSPIPVRAAPLPGVDEAMVALNQAMGAPATPITATQPGLWAGWGHPEEWIASVFRAGAAFYRARPWRHFDNFPPVVAKTPAGDTWYLSIMGSGEMEYGLAFYSDPDDLDRMLDQDVGGFEGRILSLTFDSGHKLPRPMRKEINRAGWEVASAEAYPHLLAIGTPAGGLRRADADDVVAVLAAVAAWTEAIDRDRRILSEGPWPAPETGVELEVEGFEIYEESDLPAITLEIGGPAGPGARPEGAVEKRWRQRTGPSPIDSEWLERFTAELEREGLSGKTVSAHVANVESFLEYLTNWASVPVAAVHELDLRSFLFDWYPRKSGASKTEAGRLPASLRRFFAVLDRQDGIACPWAQRLLKDKKSFMARWEASPDGFWWDEAVADWRHDHFAELDRLVLSPSIQLPGVLTWGTTQGFTEARLDDELRRHWLLWRDEFIRSGLDQSDEVRTALEQRAADWLTTPHAALAGKTPVEAIEAERSEARRRHESRR